MMTNNNFNKQNIKKTISISHLNRDNAELWFEQINNSNEYELKSNQDYVLKYLRFVHTDVPDDALIFDLKFNGKKSICNACDPSGGPYIALGEKIDNYVVKRIYYDYNNDNKLKFVLVKNDK